MPAVKKVIDEKGFYGDAFVSDKVKDRSDDLYFAKKPKKPKSFYASTPYQII